MHDFQLNAFDDAGFNDEDDSVRWDVTRLDWELGDTAKGQE